MANPYYIRNLNSRHSGKSLSEIVKSSSKNLTASVKWPVITLLDVATGESIIGSKRELVAALGTYSAALKSAVEKGRYRITHVDGYELPYDEGCHYETKNWVSLRGLVYGAGC